MNKPSLPIRLDYPHEVVPYTRVGRERWTPRAMRYLASKDALALHLRLACRDSRRALPDAAARWGVSVHVQRRTRRAYDLDNVVKAVMDAANGITWADDAQVVRIVADKHPAGADHLVVELWPIEEEAA